MSEPPFAAAEIAHREDSPSLEGGIEISARAEGLFLLGCFLASGASSLVLEIVWGRMLTLVFGSTSLAYATVLAAFMGGLALGAFLASRLADRVRDPLLAYGILEAVVAVWALSLPFLLEALRPIYREVWQAYHPSRLAFSLIRFALAASVLLVPTTCMGATLPMLGRYYAERREGLGLRVSQLYAANTWGAVAGCALGGFLLLRFLGEAATIRIAAAVDFSLLLLVGGFRLAGGGRLACRPRADSIEPGDALPPLPRGVVAAAILAYFGSGLAGMAAQVAWTRALSLVLGTSVYAFTAVVAAYLVGLAAGSSAYAAWGASVRRDGLWLAWAHLLAGAAMIAGIYLFPVLPYFSYRYHTLWQNRSHLILWLEVGLSLALIFPSAFFLGGIFPATAKICARRRGRVGSDVGRAYAANTVGAILGSFLGGFVFLFVEDLGLQRGMRIGRPITMWTIAFSGLLLCGNALLLSLASGRRRREPAGAAAPGATPGGRGLVPAAVAVLVPAILLAAVPAWLAPPRRLVHGGPVLSAAFSPDGRRVATGAEDGELRVWDARGGGEEEQVRIVLPPIERGTDPPKRHPNPVRAVAFAPDGTGIVSGSEDGRVRLWDAAAASETRVFGEAPAGEEPSAVTALAFSPAGLRIAAGDEGGSVRAFEAGTGRPVFSGEAHEGAVNAVAFSPDGRTLATAGDDGSVSLRDAGTGAERIRLQGHEGAVNAAAFSPDGRTLATAGDDGTVRLWGTREPRTEARILADGEDPVRALAFLEGGRAIAAGDKAGRIHAWRLPSGRAVRTLERHADAVTALAASQGGLLASASRDNTVLVWDRPLSRRPILELWDPVLMSSGVFYYVGKEGGDDDDRDPRRDDPMFFYREGVTTTVSVFHDAEDAELYYLSVNGKIDASSQGDMTTQVLLAHLPLLAHRGVPAPDGRGRDPRDVLVIGWGSGSTVGSCLRYPETEVRSVLACELETSVIEGSRWFERVNGRALLQLESGAPPPESPVDRLWHAAAEGMADRHPAAAPGRLRIENNDARNLLLATDRKFDVVISEPSNPWISGAAKLFTHEFYEMAASRLRPGGIWCQWIQAYGLTEKDFKVLLRTFHATFPHVAIFTDYEADLYVLGSKDPILFDVARLKSLVERGGTKNPVRADLVRENVEIDDVPTLLGHFLFGEETLHAYVDEGGRTTPLNTDDNARIEFSTPLSLLHDQQTEIDRSLQRIQDPTAIPLAFQPGTRPGEEADFLGRIAAYHGREARPEAARKLLDEAIHRGGAPAWVLGKRAQVRIAAAKAKSVTALEAILDPVGPFREAADDIVEALRLDPGDAAARGALVEFMHVAGKRAQEIESLRPFLPPAEPPVPPPAPAPAPPRPE